MLVKRRARRLQQYSHFWEMCTSKVASVVFAHRGFALVCAIATVWYSPLLEKIFPYQLSKNTEISPKPPSSEQQIRKWTAPRQNQIWPTKCRWQVLLFGANPRGCKAGVTHTPAKNSHSVKCRQLRNILIGWFASTFIIGQSSIGSCVGIAKEV